MINKILFLAVATCMTLFAQVDDKVEVPFISYEIKMGKGFDAIQANCLMCHSFGYIINQGPQSKEFWNAKVVKMIKDFKAPITKEDQDLTVKYLYENYGNGQLK